MCYKWLKKTWPKICNSISYLSLRNALINFIRLSEDKNFNISKIFKIFNIHGQVGIELLNILRLGFSLLRKWKFKNNFEDTINTLYSCSNEHCVKSVHIWSCSGPYFHASLRIQSEWGNIRTRITPTTDAFHAVEPEATIHLFFYATSSMI